LILKLETLNPIRSFKGRGASWLVAQLPVETRLVCASAGNFGQGMAYACKTRRVALTVFASANANRRKVEAMKLWGAEARLMGEDFDAAKLAAKTYAEQTASRFVEDSRDLATCEGAGTIGIELLRGREAFDTLLIPLGNGALLTGVARWLKARAPGIQVIGVCAAGAPAMAESWRTGRLVQYPTIQTVAEGIGVRVPIPAVLADMTELVDDVVLVSDEALIEGMKLLHEHAGLVVEASAAAGLAALLADTARFKGRRVVSVISGSNVTPEEMGRCLR